MVGSMRPIEIDSYVKHGAFVASWFWNNNESQWEDFFEISCIHSAKMQVNVNENSKLFGDLYLFNVTMEKTDCGKSKVNSLLDLENCHIVKPMEGEHLNCVFKLFVPPIASKHGLNSTGKCKIVRPNSLLLKSNSLRDVQNTQAENLATSGIYIPLFLIIVVMR